MLLKFKGQKMNISIILHQFFCPHEWQWNKSPFGRTYWRDNGDGTLSWRYDEYKHKCIKCGKIKYLKYIVDEGKVIK
jgi:hypothetical protein